MLSEGDIIVAQLPQADGSTKLRPVLLLRQLPGFGDFLVCGISSQIHQAVDRFDIILSKDFDGFNETGLRVPSVVRLTFSFSSPARSNEESTWKTVSDDSQNPSIESGKPPYLRSQALNNVILKNSFVCISNHFN